MRHSDTAVIPHDGGPGGWPATIEKIRGWVREAGRDAASFGIEGRLDAGTGMPDDWRSTVEEWRGLGATQFSVRTSGGGLSGPDAHVQRLREVRQILGS